jgi:multiple sugar transport system permease protein
VAVTTENGLTVAARRRPRSQQSVLRRMIRHRADYLYILPAFAVLLLVIGYPVYFTVYLSFFNTPPSLHLDDKIFVGLDNYVRIITSESFRSVTLNTVVWTVFSTFFSSSSGSAQRWCSIASFAAGGSPVACCSFPS